MVRSDFTLCRQLLLRGSAPVLLFLIAGCGTGQHAFDPRVDDRQTPRWVECPQPNGRIPIEGWLDPATAKHICEFAVAVAARCASATKSDCKVPEVDKVFATGTEHRLAAGRIDSITTDRFDSELLLIHVSFGSDVPGGYTPVLIVKLSLDGKIVPENWGVRLP